MIKVFLYGADEFLGGDVNQFISDRLSQIYKVKEEDIMFIAVHSAIYHRGVDQTSYHLLFSLELAEKYRKDEKDAKEYLLGASEDFSVHAKVEFKYLTEENVHSRIDETYPLFVTEANSIVIDDSDEEENIDIFQNFENK